MSRSHSPPRPRLAVALLSLLGACTVAAATPASGADDPLVERCGSCHRLDPAAPVDPSLAAYEAKRAPDLDIAGLKYRRGWLERWLVAPSRIRPAGFHPYAHSETGADGDVGETSTLPAHPSVAPDEVSAIVDALMTRRRDAGRIEAGAYRRGATPRTMLELNFTKFKGCGSCHRTAEDLGGTSGPELYTAFERLEPDFLVSFILDPQAWDRRTPMPSYGLSAADASKLVDYLRTLSEAPR